MVMMMQNSGGEKMLGCPRCRCLTFVTLIEDWSDGNEPLWSASAEMMAGSFL